MEDNGILGHMREAMTDILQARLPAYNASKDGDAVDWVKGRAKMHVLEAGDGTYVKLTAAGLLDAALSGNMQAMKLLLSLTEPEPTRDDGMVKQLECELFADDGD